MKELIDFFWSYECLMIAPLIIVAVGAFALLALELLGLRIHRVLFIGAICVSAWCFSLVQYSASGEILGGFVHCDAMNLLLYSIILFGTLIATCMCSEQLTRQRAVDSVDVYVLLLLAAFGAMVMVSSVHLLGFFVGFETMSIAVYALTGIARKEPGSSEAALKYFVLGAFSSAFLLFGIALVFGAVGTMHYEGIAAASVNMEAALRIGLSLILVGMFFKVGLVPFHFWTPDVYQGAPVSIAAFMAVVVKAAAVGALIRLMAGPFALLASDWTSVLWGISILTMTVGNLAALKQTSVKRMLAYSSIAHAGYILLGFMSVGGDRIAVENGIASVLFYLAAYAFMTIGAFAVVLAVTSGRDAQYVEDDIASFRGLGWRYPLLGIAMTIFMCSLAGMPPLAGFVGKLYLFVSAVRTGYVDLAIIAAVNSVVSLYYYLRVVVVMYFEDGTEDVADYPGYSALGTRFAIGVAALGTVVLGLASGRLYEMAVMAVSSARLI